VSDRNGEVEDVDLLVVDGGKAGKSLAMDRAKAGWTVAMVERDNSRMG
jgi:probable pyridine nucleotide-disulfide oxidoreductase